MIMCVVCVVCVCTAHGFINSQLLDVKHLIIYVCSVSPCIVYALVTVCVCVTTAVDHIVQH